MPQAAGKVIAGCFALTAFAVAVLAGLLAHNTMLEILGRATIALVVCYPAGFLIGLVVEHVIAQHVRDHMASNPVPDSSILDSFEAEAGVVRTPRGGGGVDMSSIDPSEEVIEA